MKTEKEGEWYVTTPVIVGMGPMAIPDGLGCAHIWSSTAKPVRRDMEGYGTSDVVFESCVKCSVAVRCRWRPCEQA